MKIRNIASTANWNKISLSKSTKIAQIKTLITANYKQILIYYVLIFASP